MRLVRLPPRTAHGDRLARSPEGAGGPSGATFRLVAVLTVGSCPGGSVEALVDSGDFHSTWDGIWWAMETVTTVGYGDLYPESVGGRIVAMVVMLFGIGFLSVLTATVAVLRQERSGNETEAILGALTRLKG